MTKIGTKTQLHNKYSIVPNWETVSWLGYKCIPIGIKMFFHNFNYLWTDMKSLGHAFFALESDGLRNLPMPMD